MPARDETFLVKRIFLLCVLSAVYLPSIARSESPTPASSESEIKLRIQGGREWLSDDAETQRLAGEAYNLGTHYLEDDQPGKAHAWLLFSKTLASKDSTIEHNLKLATERLVARVGKAAVEPARQEWEALISRGTLKAVIDLFCALILSLSLGLGLWKRLSPQAKNEPLSPGSTSLLPGAWNLTAIGLGLAGLGASQVILGSFSQEAKAVLIDETVLRSGPGDSYVSLAPLDAGTVLPVETARAGKGASSLGRWLQVRHAHGELGWIPESTCLPLSKNWP